MPDVVMHHTELASPELTCMEKLDHMQPRALAAYNGYASQRM